MAIMADLDHDTVDFKDNYDGKEQEPAVLPSRIPNLLVNGSDGIAVGMATNIPPHNLGEVVDACLAMIDDPDDLRRGAARHRAGPGLSRPAARSSAAPAPAQALLTGRGSVIVRGVGRPSRSCAQGPRGDHHHRACPTR